MFKSFKKELEELKLQHAILERHSDPAEQDRLLDFYVDILPRVAGAMRCGVFIIDPEDHQVWLRAGTGVEERQIIVPEDSSIVGKVIKTGEPLIADHLEKEKGAHKQADEQTGFQTRQVLCVPIKGFEHGKVIGAIELLNKHEGSFSKQDEKMLAEAARHVALFIGNIYLKQQVATLSEKVYDAGRRTLSVFVFVLAGALGLLGVLLFVWLVAPSLFY